MIPNTKVEVLRGPNTSNLLRMSGIPSDIVDDMQGKQGVVASDTVIESLENNKQFAFVLLAGFEEDRLNGWWVPTACLRGAVEPVVIPEYETRTVLVVPEGYRWLEAGEIRQEGDLVNDYTAWKKTKCAGRAVVYPQSLIRRIA